MNYEEELEILKKDLSLYTLGREPYELRKRWSLLKDGYKYLVVYTIDGHYHNYICYAQHKALEHVNELKDNVSNVEVLTTNPELNFFPFHKTYLANIYSYVRKPKTFEVSDIEVLTWRLNFLSKQ